MISIGQDKTSKLLVELLELVLVMITLKAKIQMVNRPSRILSLLLLNAILGYYMYIESSSRNPNDTAKLISPIYPKMPNSSVCFEFYYHMFGITMGSLRVYLKKISEPWNLTASKAFFVRSGNQGNKWYRGFQFFDSINEDYQVRTIYN